MLKQRSYPFQLIFDIETVPCLETARRVYPELQALSDELDTILADPGIKKNAKKHSKIDISEGKDKVLLTKLYEISGATEDNPRPFLKYFLHRVVSVSGISRKQVAVDEDHPFGIDLAFFSLPNGDLDIPEATILDKFLRGIGERQPQLIGWCSTLFDMPCMMQRAMINGLELPKLQRPPKPWEGADYFQNGSDYNIDIMKLIDSSSPQSKATLDEFARACRIPGKMGVSGDQVAEMWFSGHYREIVNYNECDTATTYLIWLEMLKLSGHVSLTDYDLEKELFRKVLDRKIESGSEHLKAFLLEWNRLQGIVPPSETDTLAGIITSPNSEEITRPFESTDFVSKTEPEESVESIVDPVTEPIVFGDGQDGVNFDSVPGPADPIFPDVPDIPVPAPVQDTEF